MYIVNLTKWDPNRIVGQEKMLADAWIEAVSDDCSHVAWPPIFSTLQLLRNLRNVIQDISRGTLRPYQLTHCIEEIEARFEKPNWLNNLFDPDIKLLMEKLRWVKDHTKTEDAAHIRGRSEVGSYLNAFITKVELADPIENQIRRLADLNDDATTRFHVLTASIHELINEIMHFGHSRAHLIRWMISKIINGNNLVPYSESFRRSQHLIETDTRSYEVLFNVATPNFVRGSQNVEILDQAPNGWNLDDRSKFKETTKSRIAKVSVSSRDAQGAIRLARASLSRFLWSSRYGNVDFDRALSRHAVAKIEGESNSFEEPEPRHLHRHRLRNGERLHSIDPATRNPQTFSALQRILFWLEQAHRVEPIAAVISQWTALEFLFSVTGNSDLSAVAQYAPSYITTLYPRSVLLNFWRFLEHSDAVLDQNLEVSLGLRVSSKGRRTCDLKLLLEQCLVPEATNKILPLLSEYPILISKFHQVRKLEPGSYQLRAEIENYSRGVIFDIRTCYRARNTVVHDAADSIAENECLAQRLNWIVTTCMDEVIFQFSKSPTLSLLDIHRCKLTSFEKWRKTIGDSNNLCTFQEIVEPTNFFM